MQILDYVGCNFFSSVLHSFHVILKRLNLLGNGSWVSYECCEDQFFICSIDLTLHIFFTIELGEGKEGEKYLIF